MILEKVLVWFRRDLRDTGHAALAAALGSAQQVFCALIFERQSLDAQPSRQDRRVHFIRDSLLELDAALRARGGGVIVRHGQAREAIPAQARQLGVAAVFANRDYEPAAKRRDAAVATALGESGIDFADFKDQAIVDGDEVLTQAGRPFSVFTPYQNAWLKRLTAADHAVLHADGSFAAIPPATIPTLAEIGLAENDLATLGIRPGMAGARALWDELRASRTEHHGARRDCPAVKGVSYLSVHLRFGTISIRELVRTALARQADAWLNKLIWRAFYSMILDRFPQVVDAAFKPEYDAIDSDDRGRGWPPGSRAAPATRWSMRRCAS